MINKLKYFLAAAKNEHFGLAAESLFITQPALSASIARLEKELDVKLFNRIGRNVKLTKIGKSIIPDIKEICEHYDNILDIIYQSKESSTNKIRFGTVMRHSVIIVDQFLNDNPGKVISYSQYTSYNDIKNALLEHKLDICTCSPPVTGQGITTSHIINEPICLLMNKKNHLAKKSKISLKEISGEKILMPLKSNPFRITLDNLYRQTGYEHPECVMEAENASLILYLETSRGFDCLLINPIARCRELVKTNTNFTFVPLSDDICFREIGVSWLDEYPPNKNTNNLIQTMHEYYLSGLYSSLKDCELLTK